MSEGLYLPLMYSDATLNNVIDVGHTSEVESFAKLVSNQ